MLLRYFVENKPETWNLKPRRTLKKVRGHFIRETDCRGGPGTKNQRDI